MGDMADWVNDVSEDSEDDYERLLMEEPPPWKKRAHAKWEERMREFLEGERKQGE